MHADSNISNEAVERSLAMHLLSCEKLRLDPSLLGVARARVLKWLATTDPRCHGYLNEWLTLIDLGADACIAMMTEQSEHAADMRSSSPMHFLSDQERFEFFAEWRRMRAKARS